MLLQIRKRRRHPGLAILARNSREGRLSAEKTSPFLRFLLAVLIFVAIAFVAFFIGYLLGMRLAGV